ncbi:hypothetical protein FQN54_002653 [Arachnomyces sp. PD_36]|nr:hypothetical protein FQN54_002653 [Arachnomyces sp. PD_36]
METINPCEAGKTTGQPEDLNSEFITHCPPDVQLHTRILAVCGVTDYADDASPTKSGFFLSDFYLFFQLLQPSHDFPDSSLSRQLWLTCESPRALVEKYSEYAHGDPLKDRRIVLEDRLLPSIENSERLRVVPRALIHERFLASLREQSRLAVEQGEPLLILIFGHGDAGSYGIQLGGDGNTDEGPRMLIDQVQLALRPGTQATLLMTSCYSGGWLVRPDLKSIRPALDVTGIAAADHEHESYSWPVSSSVGRACGSRVTSAILRTLVDLDHPAASRDEMRYHPTYIELSERIRETLKKIDPLVNESGMRFSAQDDNWETEYRRRSGLPLLSYQTRWESLRLLRPGGGKTSNPGDPDESVVDRSASIERGGFKRRAVRYLGQIYLNSFPGLDEAGTNGALHRTLRSLIKDYNTKELEPEHTDMRLEQVLYRLDAMHEADRMRRHLNLEFPSIFAFDEHEWRAKHTGNKRVYDTMSELSTNLASRKLFDPAVCPAGPTYMKPRRYLAVALMESGLQIDEIEDRINALVSCKFFYDLLRTN